ncbi:glycosyltransferase family protein [Oscillospiraceae bacterium MB08-C2-2]|nr:glycosyltransferase family protein [Oscillospiraceae bacterium MB08-C2-2]
MVKATAIVQARMSSSRLPGKVLMNLEGKPLIVHLLERLSQCRHVGHILLATSDSPSDDPLAAQVEQAGFSCFRGSLDDVLARFYKAALTRPAQVIVRVCGDSPLLDPFIVDSAIEQYNRRVAAIVKTVGMPLGLGTEVFSFSALQEAFQKGDAPYHREHVTPYIYENFPTYTHTLSPDLSRYRLVVDTPEDFALISAIYKALYKGKHDFYLNELASLLEKRPELAEINREIQQIQVPLHIKEGL